MIGEANGIGRAGEQAKYEDARLYKQGTAVAPVQPSVTVARGTGPRVDRLGEPEYYFRGTVIHTDERGGVAVSVMLEFVGPQPAMALR